MKSRKGVRANANSVEIDFYYKDRRRKETLFRGLAPTETNMAAAEGHRTNFLKALATEKVGGKPIVYEEWFPDSLWLKRNKKNAEVTGNLSTALTQWFNSMLPSLSHATARSYRQYITKLSKRWGDLAPAELTMQMLRAWVAEQQLARVRVKTIRNNLAPLNGVFSLELQSEAIEFNPIDRLVIRKPKWEEVADATGEPDVDPFDVDEISRLVAAAPDYMRNMVRFGFWTGLRLGEIFALAWEDVDLVKGTIRVRRARTEKVLGVPKTQWSIRDLDLLPPALDALKAQKAMTYMLPGIECEDFGDLRFVFRSYNGQPWMEDHQLRYKPWKLTCIKAGVRYRYPYQMRHTFATNCISSGEDEEWLAHYLGHRDVTMLRKHYAKWRPKMAKLAGNVGGVHVMKLIGGGHG